ncbi:FISUMP domain-containing protein [uncultured Fibrobacter sp.]|uniref:FISUMP domain-containing protein n=1 Tax=uncultured Fibrobacter sp. TaxID=261512 RepID=UPI00260CB07D|nr:FISUMP domain-containing protein [uncultured Fibrobacter sp.]
MKIQTKKQAVIARDVPSMQSIVAMFIAALLLAACGDDNKNAGGTVEDGEVVAIVDKTISGVSQKGPFVNGSSVTVQELNGETLAQTGDSYEGKIRNDLGEFSVKVSKLASQYALLKASGFYRNEVTGEKSKSQITLYALTDLSDRDEVNVNLLTHLAYERALYLANDDSVKVAAAKKQSEAEVLKSFAIEGDFGAAEDLNIFGESDESAALLAVSILMQGDLNEADFSERLANYAADIEIDGKWDDDEIATDIADWANAQWLGSGLTKIRENITKWNRSSDVPEFEKYVNNFWWQNYGLGTCDKKRKGEVLKNQNKASVNAEEYYICKSKSWQVASDIEKDTYKWLDPTAKRTEKDGDVRYGDVVKTNCYVFEDGAWRSGNANDCSLDLRGCTTLRQNTVGLGSDDVWHICDNKKWRNATDIEKDTSGWLPGSDGDSKVGNVNSNNCYVFENNVWRSGNESDCSLKLRGCTALRQDTVGLGSDDVWHICDNKKWRNATDIEKDTATWGAGTFDGEVRAGQVDSSNYYIYGTSNHAWRIATTLEKDTYDYINNMDWLAGTDGEIKKGSVTGSVYVYDASKWRAADDVEKVLGGCVAAIADSVGKAGSSYYICTPRKWVTATALQYDTYRRNCTEFGQMIHGNVNQEYAYFCYGNEWKYFVGNESIPYGKLVDERDGEIYRTVQIGGQIWMAENLSYAGSESTVGLIGKSWCDNNDVENCNEAGLLYSRKESITVCPDGWRLPRQTEWHTLIATVGGNAVAGKVLKSRTGWDENGNFVLGGDDTDVFGFSALVVGNDNGDTWTWMEETINKFWSSTQTTGGQYYEDLDTDYPRRDYSMSDMNAYAVRCISEQSEYSGTLKDSRDDQVYKTIIIGSQTWMAENLNYEMTGSYCREDNEDNCIERGRLYTWNAAMESCPNGWHLPTDNDLFILSDDIASGYRPALSEADAAGFAALPGGGYRDDKGNYSYDEAAYFWGSEEVDSLKARSFNSYNYGFPGPDEYKTYGYSVRCVKDEESP